MKHRHCTSVCRRDCLARTLPGWPTQSRFHRPGLPFHGARECSAHRYGGSTARSVRLAVRWRPPSRHGGSGRRTPWSRQQRPEREPPEPATRPIAFESANPSLYFTAGRPRRLNQGDSGNTCASVRTRQCLDMEAPRRFRLVGQRRQRLSVWGKAGATSLTCRPVWSIRTR